MINKVSGRGTVLDSCSGGLNNWIRSKLIGVVKIFIADFIEHVEALSRVMVQELLSRDCKLSILM